MSVTIREIAQKARVSKSTVSRVINRSGPVSKETERVVLAAIESYQYQPSEIARSLTLKKTRTVCLIVQDIRNPYYSLACWYAERFFRDAGYTTVICNADSDPSVERSVLDAMRQRRVDGVLCIGGHADTSAYDRFSEDGATAVVLVDREIENPSVSNVVLNNVYGGRIAVDYLFSLGHRRIGFATSEFTAAEKDRYEGYLQEHRHRGVRADQNLVINLSEKMWHRGELNSLLRIFSTREKPTALFASNDYKALQILRLFKRNSIRVPEDISVIGFDDISIASMVHPALTTVHQPIDRMVERGAELLLARIAEGGRGGERQVMNPWLIERESTTASS
jgi:DNA-binding LacI/PurR family transcriptional regulator